MIYRGYKIDREKIDSQVRWTVYAADGSFVHVTAEGEEAALARVDAEKKKQLTTPE